MSTTFDGIKINPVGFDYPDVTTVRSIDYSKGKGFGTISIDVDGQAALSRIEQERAINGNSA